MQEDVNRKCGKPDMTDEKKTEIHIKVKKMWTSDEKRKKENGNDEHKGKKQKRKKNDKKTWIDFLDSIKFLEFLTPSEYAKSQKVPSEH